MNLNIFNTSGLFVASTNLFQQLGIKLNSNTAEALNTKDLLKSFYKENETFHSIKSTYFIGIIDDSVFQATGLFDANYSIKEALQQGDKNYDGLMLFALELTKKPTRTEISEITRAFNRISQKMPVALVLKYSIDKEAVISIAISERFKYLQNWRQGEKAGKVIILRDIFTSNTHAGHQRILLDLVKPAGVTNYAQLHAQWLEVLDVNILNKKFFQELANWYFWAMDKVQFPDDIEKKKDVRNATNLIRLITRVIFIWFIKEKHLVPATLFNEKYLSTILKDFQKNKKSGNYYQAILQNLFFGTLNQKMDERDFAEDHNRTNKLDQGIKNKYRYPDKFNISKKEIIDLFKDIPFLNGGLFDCLDKFDEEKLQKGKKEQIFVDGFTRLDGKQAIVPDYLFFGVYTDIDLTEYYDPEAKKTIVKNVKGLIDILNDFKFTVAENTPIEEEIALDPELLGKVFENLLASYNPETKTTARKQTGSFYTPREIVNYMVEESLIEYLKQSLKSSSPESGEVARSAGGVKNLNNLPHLKTFRKTLRNNLTPAEAKLWTLLKGKQLEGKNFRRQFSVANYILDFYCPSENLAIEMDGQGHFEYSQAEYDYERDLFLQYCGIKVLRFENKWVWENPEGLLQEIKNNFGWNKQPLSPSDSSPLQGVQLLDAKLRSLFSYNDEGNPLNSKETDALIEAINNAKILDPACGSGAFPMGVLHKMVHLLQKLDPNNIKWKEQQRKKIIGNHIKELEKDRKAIAGLSDKAVREKAIQAVDERLKEIDEIFESKNNFDDYARKLYLIENCIYGIDIQPIAVQISKLRFFISLIIDQDKDSKKENLGFRALPNLETKFVAANTLIALEKPIETTGDLFLSEANEKLNQLKEQLKQIRHFYFSASSRKQKIEFQKKDKEYREEISKLLTKEGWKTNVADQIASFDPYDQNHFANWFEPEWMFGNEVKDGFDVVIGNPPYVDSETMTKDNPEFREYLKSKFQSAEGNWDLFVVFTEMGLKLCKSYGSLAFIVPNKIISAKYTYSLRTIICKLSPREIIDYSYVNVFKEADVYPVVILISNQETYKYQVSSKVMYSLEEVKTKNLINSIQFTSDIFWDKYFFNPDVVNLIIKITSNDKLINTFPNILGAATVNEAYQIKEVIKELEKEKKYFKFINTGTIDPYKSLWSLKQTQYIKGNYHKPIVTKTDLDEINRTRTSQSSSPKIIVAGMALRIEAFFDEYGFYCAGKSTTIILGESQNLKTLTGIINSKLVSYWFSKYFNSLSMAGGYFNIGNNELGLIPLPNLIFPNNQINKLVDNILLENSNNVNFDTTSIEKQIDELVYKLYDLTEEEIAIIENSNNKTTNKNG